MKCPACYNTLEEIKAGDILVDICSNGCGGIWFDQFELKKFDEPHEFADENILLSKGKGVAVVHEDGQGARSCPKCYETAFLIRRAYSVKEQIEVDQCSKCSGIWLDVGELNHIRGEYGTEEERIKAADEFLAPLQAEVQASFEQEMQLTRDKIQEFKDAKNFFEKFSLIVKELIS